MRILIFHGYLLHGTGSNVYNASLAAALASLGHEVHLLCQDRDPGSLPFVDAVGVWEGGALRVSAGSSGPRCTVYRPDLGGLLPVYVADRYEGMEARTFPELDDVELARYLDRNVAAVRDVVDRAPPDVALANHLIMGPAILRRALDGSGVPYAVKVHGSALEYTVKPHLHRFLPYAREGLDGTRTVLVGSRHTAESLWATLEDPALPARTRLGPPGVDVAAFAPRSPAEAADGLAHLVRRLSRLARSTGSTGSAFARHPRAAAEALRSVQVEGDRLVAFVGKLIVSKGVDLLLAAWPLVLARVPEARLVVVGFGAYEDACRKLVAVLAAGDLASARELARAGRSLEGGPSGGLAYMQAFFDRLEADSVCRASYVRAARDLEERVAFAGRLEHDELSDLLPACEALVVPSTFPEAFGMVAAEAAATGAWPVSAEHSGLAEVSRVLGAGVPESARGWLSFPLGANAVSDLAASVVGWLTAPENVRRAGRTALAATARERYSWEGVAERVIAAAQGRLDELPAP
ncbi:MAG: glycosyltransferase [Actinomycetota bacterium]|nr:glycosyltransferase [Actinomycetota bacterium]